MLCLSLGPRSVGRSVRWLIGPSDLAFYVFAVFGLIALAKLTSNTAPAYRHATGVAVYPTWFVFVFVSVCTFLFRYECVCVNLYVSG